MALFTNPRRKLARDTAQRMISGHTSLLAYWALRHAGVWAAMAGKEGVTPPGFAEQTNMAPEVLEALLEYLERQGLVARRDDVYRITPTGEALAEFEDGVLEHVWAHESILQMIEHVLARLKIHSVSQKYEALAAGQASRWAEEVYPAIARAAEKLGVTHVLDLGCGTGGLLCCMAEHSKRIVGVGVGADGVLVRQANELIARRGLEKRLIAVPAGAVEICTDPRATFDRTGITTQLWERFDGLVACGLLTGMMGQGRETVAAMLRRIPLAFPGAAFILAEPCAGPRWERNYYAAEMELLLRLSRGEMLREDAWRAMLTDAGFESVGAARLQTDGLCLFTCRSAKAAAKPAVKMLRRPVTPA